MANVILGEMCRLNFGICNNYDPSLRTEYKAYIDQLYHDMIASVYGTDPTACQFSRTYDLLQTQDEIDMGLGEEKFKELEDALKYYCKVHNVTLMISRGTTDITISIDMFTKYEVRYI